MRPGPEPERNSSSPLSESRPVGQVGTTLLGAFLLLFGALLLALLFSIWPTLERVMERSGQGGSSDLFGVSITPGTALIVLVIVVSALGSFVHAATSFGDYVGNRRLVRSWLWWYILRVFVGVALALLFYFAVRGGFFATEATSQAVNPFGIAALAGLVGLFSKQATDKLKEVFDTLFRTAPGQGDDLRKDGIGNPKPTVAGIEPPTIVAGSDTVTLRVRGEGFILQSQVRITRLDTDVALERTATFVGPSELTVMLLKEDLEKAGVFQVTVFNPEPGGGTSEPIRIDVRAETSVGAAGTGRAVTRSTKTARGLGLRRPRRP